MLFCSENVTQQSANGPAVYQCPLDSFPQLYKIGKYVTIIKMETKMQMVVYISCFSFSPRVKKQNCSLSVLIEGNLISGIIVGEHGHMAPFALAS